jgi:hypothetical protein
MSMRVTPGFHFATALQDDDPIGRVESEEGGYVVSLLIGAKNPQAVEAGLVSKILADNAELNVKDRDQLLLLNKQGIVLLSRAATEGAAARNTFERNFDLIELARVFQMFLEAFPGSRNGNQVDFVDYIYTRIRSFVEYPDAVLAHSFTNRLAWQLLVDAFSLKQQLQMITNNYRQIVADVDSKEHLFAQMSHSWWTAPDFSAAFDMAALAMSKALARLKDDTLRRSILEDLREAETSFASKNIKAAVVMAGAAVEAILLALLEQETTLPSASLRSKGFHELIEEVRKEGLVNDTAMLDLLDNSLRQWRNFIHPGKALRTGVTLTSDHAKIVVAAASGLARSLT